ncbi:MAG: high frequency lysogenization protein HflD [Thiomicrorhabdus chilensis]|uniref:high frequency lysogenization protein HflD n=1 Tax=Thiomicrorhabdus chilensis TaxID=63656 RepID=UPI00299D141C|nr:high frequency lysogenization protein HflD [Thiomicrorhabdus chilensis]MDX1348326.1 high frequency lysogenization protein HflD [Thiomicrorhabdus chilensis]
MSEYTDQDRAIALIGIYQTAKMVYDLATTGNTNDKAFQTSIDSLFCDQPDNTLAVYGGEVENIQLGVNTLLAQMSSDQAIQNRNVEVTRYVLSMIILEKKLNQIEGKMGAIYSGLETARAQREHFSDFHENVIASLANTYSKNVSDVSPRVMVNGQHGHLQNSAVANKIRALLLAGIRSATLWRQVGGSRWGLIWSRKKYLRAAQALSRGPQDSQPPSFFNPDN